jgi:hypothetical protein
MSAENANCRLESASMKSDDDFASKGRNGIRGHQVLQINLRRGSLSSINREQCSKAIFTVNEWQQREIESSRQSLLKRDFCTMNFANHYRLDFRIAT